MLSYLHAFGAFVTFSVKDCKREYVLDSIVCDISDTMQKKYNKKGDTGDRQ